MNSISRLAELAEKRVNKYGAQYYTFALFVILHYPLSYFYEISTSNLVTNFWIRLIPVILCLSLLFKNSWPQKTRVFIPLFWYFTVMISVPTMCSYLVLKNNFSIGWLINFNIGAIILICLLDWISFVVVELVGLFVGVVLFYLLGNNFPELPDHHFYQLFFFMFFYIVFCGAIFTRNKEVYNDYLQRAKDDLNSHLEKLVNVRTEELQRALQAKSEFLNNMSHEIRTPIQGFTSISEGLVEHWRDFDENKRLNLASQVASNAKRLAKLLGHLLDLSKFSAGKMILCLNELDLNELVFEMIAECEQLYLTDKEIKFIFNNIPNAKIKGDSARINQVLRNLFVNAIKFSPSDGVIEVDLKIDQQLIFSISDQGVGVPKSELSSIFQAFNISSRTKTKAGGTGLGLSICKEIIESHGGRIWAENNEGRGAVFRFSLPIN